MTKKEKINHTARDLFFKHGFKRVTIDEICRKSHVSRKTYYTIYENKNALILNLLKELTEDSIAQFKDIIYSNLSFTEKIEKSLAQKYSFSKTISKEFVADLMDPGAGEILTYWQLIMQDSMILLKEFLQDAQRKGEMNPNLKLSYVMWFMQHMTDLMKSEELLSQFDDMEDMTRQLSESMIYGLMPVK
jgi:AcrR family transcriptional regulator